MPLTNREAYELKREGTTVPVVCNECDETVWTRYATYIEGEDEWYCSECQDDLIESFAEELSNDGDVSPEDVRDAIPDDWGDDDG